ncbi:MAG: LPS-assembly protein LptD [Deltaproteobacteria bacterium]|nr:LPS-assembly protein LptD [Deltaproteobacteria bacterium]
MSRLLRACLAAAALGAAARADVPAERPAVEILEVGELSYEKGTGAASLRGGVRLRREELTLRAEEAHWDPARQELRARGNVLLAGPGRALLADRLRLGGGGAFEAQGVRAWTKEGAVDLSACRDAGDVERSGRSRFTFAGDSLSASGPEEALRLTGARLTLCDCGGGPPSWEIRARRADIEQGKGVTLEWPVLYVTPRFLGLERPVPVLALPWGYLPLGDRQTGLLPPELRLEHGFTVRLPVFLALSRSWDATIAPEWITGSDDRFRALSGRGVRGPGLALELRWAPAAGASGLLRVHLLHSTYSAWPEGVWRPPGMDRIGLQLRHAQRLGDDGTLVADLSAVGDPFYVADFTGDVMLRGASYRRSALWAGLRGSDLWLSAEAGYLEPLSVDGSDPRLPGRPAPAGRAPFGRFGTDLSTFHRLPSLALRLLPRPLAGPLRLGGLLELARFGALRGASGDEGADGIGAGGRGWGAAAVGADRQASWRGPDAGERDGVWELGERLAATRAHLRAELSAPVAAGRFLAVEPWLAASASAYAFDGSGARRAERVGSARLSGGLALSTELARTFGSGDGRLFHAWEPRAEWRFGSRASGPVLPSGLAFDGADLAPAGSGDPTAPARSLSAAPPSGYQQLRLELRSRLSGLPGGAAGSLSLGQDLDLGNGRRAESFAGLSLRAGPVTCDVESRFYSLGAGRPPGAPAAPFPSGLDRLGELRAVVTVGGPRAEVHASFLAFGPGGSQRLAAGEDPLFDPRPLGLDPVAQGSAGFRVRWSAATLAYDLDYTARKLAVPLVEGGTLDPHVFQHTARLGWDSPCRCFKLGVSARLREKDKLPTVGLTFDLGPVVGGS